MSMNSIIADHRPAHGSRGVIRLAGYLLLWLLAPAASAATDDAARDDLAAETQGAANEEVYRIGVPDLLSVRVWEQEELSGPALVRTDGRISIPLIGDVQAEGRTPEELADAIEAGLSAFVTNPRVDIAVVEMRSQVISVIGGGIETSGVIELRHQMRVLDAIAEMGGFTPFAKKNRIRVLRDTADGQTELPFDYTSFINGRAPGSNFLLEPGDTVIVPD